MKPLTLFSWGYYGWGTATDRLIEMVDAVERNRGFEPPVFVEVRIKRSGKAPGFVGKAFDNLLGADRYQWMQDLGNEGIVTKTGLKIKNPAAAKELLSLTVMDFRTETVVSYSSARASVQGLTGN